MLKTKITKIRKVGNIQIRSSSFHIEGEREERERCRSRWKMFENMLVAPTWCH